MKPQTTPKSAPLFAPNAVTRSTFDYPAWLSSCWAEACAERTEDAPTVVSTFAGCGGSSLGYAMAGYRELAVVEWDDDAVRVFRDNFVTGPVAGDEQPWVYHGDIAKLSADELKERTGLDTGDLDVFDGSPPCQGFSTAGRRRLEDSRNQLFIEFARLISELQPRVFVMENVRGMVIGDMKPVFAEILRHLKSLGYWVEARLVVASWLGVPQRRPRMIFIGTRNDLEISPAIMYPQPWAFEPTVQQAIADLQDAPHGPVCAPAGKSEELMRVIPRGRSGAHVTGKNGFGLVRAKWTSPSMTIVKTHNPRQTAGMLHPLENRYMSIQELKRLGSFPDDFVFGCERPDWWDGVALPLESPAEHRRQIQDVWARIGNSVPPLMMRSIALAIRQGLS